jgi:ketosteroid isomerase-like protein
MSQQNVEIVSEALARFSEADFESTLELIGEDALWEPSGQFVGSGGGCIGHREIRRF